MAAVAVSVVCYLGAYRRQVAGAMLGGVGGVHSALRLRMRRLAALLGRVIVPHPIARAYFSFTLRTIVRSPKHRLIMGAAVGAAMAFVLAGASVGLEQLNPLRPGSQILSAQFVFAIFVLAGARLAFGVPTMLSASWAFRFHGPEIAEHCATGARRALVAVGLVPLLLLLLPIHAVLFGWRLAGLHAACGLLASLGLIEILLAGFPKVPFAAAYVPGGARIRSRLSLYLFGFQAFAYVLAGIESLLLPSPRGIAAMLGVLGALYAYLGWRRRRRSRETVLVYDEDPPDTVQTLGLTGPSMRLEAKG